MLNLFLKSFFLCIFFAISLTLSANSLDNPKNENKEELITLVSPNIVNEGDLIKIKLLTDKAFNHVFLFTPKRTIECFRSNFGFECHFEVPNFGEYDSLGLGYNKLFLVVTDNNKKLLEIPLESVFFEL